MTEHYKDDMANEVYAMHTIGNYIKYAIVILYTGILLIMIILFSSCAYSYEPKTYTFDQIANAIYKTEGGIHTRYPYGVLKHYKHTTPRQACINTIKHSYKRWYDGGRKGDFVKYLGTTYSPPSVNPNWYRLTTYFLMKG